MQVVIVEKTVNVVNIKDYEQEVGIFMKDVKKRLYQFGEVEPKWMVYTGDFNTTLTKRMCDEVYGVDNYTIINLILPSFDKRLVEFASEQIKDRKNVKRIVVSERTCTPDDWSSCNWLNFSRRYHEEVGGLRIVSCYVERGVTRDYWDKTSEYYGEKLKQDGKMVLLFLYHGLNLQELHRTYYTLFENEKDTWDYWRAVSCSVGIEMCAFERGRKERYALCQCWKEYKNKRGEL
ncbi:hypothetical protein KKH23_05245 [Patescibacteria group bacterium]|nr:hypothetical protein [Patescibacteria group bacterium]